MRPRRKPLSGASLPPVTTPDPGAQFAPARRLTGRQVRDLVALLLLLVGSVGLVATAWAFNPLAGRALLFLMMIGAGVVLGLDR